MTDNERNNWQKKNKSNTFPKALKINKKLIYSTLSLGMYVPLLRHKFHQSQQNTRIIYLISFNKAITNSGLTNEEFETTFKSLKLNKATDATNATGITNTSSNIILDIYDKIENILFSVFK